MLRAIATVVAGYITLITLVIILSGCVETNALLNQRVQDCSRYTVALSSLTEIRARLSAQEQSSVDMTIPTARTYCTSPVPLPQQPGQPSIGDAATLLENILKSYKEPT